MKQQSEQFRTWVLECKRLRKESDEATADFFYEVERGEKNEHMWKNGSGYATFSDVLAGECICSETRYAAYKKAVERWGFARVRSFGVEQVREVLVVPSSEPSKSYVGKTAEEAIFEDLKATQERNGGVVSRRQVEAVVKKHHQPPKKDPPKPDEVTIEGLKVTVSALRAEITILERQKKRLEKENTELKKKLEKCEGKGRERKGNA